MEMALPEDSSSRNEENVFSYTSGNIPILLLDSSRN